MKNFGRTFSPAGVAGALALLVAAPQAASAQAVGGYLRPGGGRGGASSPVPDQAPQVVMPMRSGAISARPGGPFGASPGYNQPTYNQPTFNRPVFNPPVYNNAPVYNNMPSYGPPGYSNAPSYSNAPVFRRERPSGPAVVVPDPFEATPSSGYRRPRPGRSGGSANGYSNQSISVFGSRNGYSNTGDIRPTRPVGPAYGYSNSGSFTNGSDLRITTPLGAQHVPPTVYRNNYIYNNYNVNRSTVIVNAPPLLGGYYYGNYCDTYVQAATYPSVYSVYAGFPQYIFNAAPNVIIVGQPVYLPYVTPYLPFDTPNYSVTYNQNNYYVASESRAREIEGGGAPARAALKNAYPADSYQAAFADIARAWTEGDIAPLRKHSRDTDTRISVFLNKKYSYSIASGDFLQITRDALDRLHTVSFDFTRLRKAKTGDVTAYGAHVYRTGDGQSGKDGGTVPFDGSSPDAGATDADGTSREATSPYDKADDPAVGVEKTVYVSYTLRHRDGQWYITSVDSSDHALVPAQ